MTYEIVDTDSTPYGTVFYLSTVDSWQPLTLQDLPSDYSDIIAAAEAEFYDSLDDGYGDIEIPLLGTYGMGELFYRLASETDQRVYIGDYAAERYEEVSFIEALNATQEETDCKSIVPEVEAGEPDSALELLVDLDQDTRVIVELSPRGARYRLPRELGVYKGSRREWQSMDTDDIDGLTLTELLDEIYEKLSE